MQASKSFFPLLTAILLAADISGCSTKEHQDPRNLPDLVRIATVEPPRQGDRSFTGVVTARVQSDLGFRVPGKVTKRLVDVGQNVRAGQPLMRIDVTDYAHAITTQTQNVEAARVKAEQAVVDEARYRGLVSTGAVSASTYDQVKAAADAAKVVEATVQRSRPVALTALAAVLAFIPLTFSVFWGSLAYTLIGGTAVGTVLTLVFLPALYTIWFRVKPTVREPAFEAQLAD